MYYEILATKIKLVAQEDGGRRLVIPPAYYLKNLETQNSGARNNEN